jgi:hypothetical protein
MKIFETWFPIDETDTKEDIERYKERFAATKLCLELGEYTGYLGIIIPILECFDKAILNCCRKTHDAYIPEHPFLHHN